MEERIICADCGREITDNSYVELPNGDFLCEDCYDENYYKCDYCGNIIRKEDAYETSNGDIVCDYCFENHYTRCEACDEIVSNNDITYVDGSCICYGCLDYNDDYRRCDDCGEWHHVNNLYWNDRDDCYYCENCERYHRHGLIADYHNHDNPIQFFGDNKGNTVPYMGAEIEIDNGEDNEDCAEFIQNQFVDNFIYFEEDGSLNCGFECITQPATLEYHTSIKKDYEDAFKGAVSRGYRAHNTRTCGLHVHFNRGFFKDNEDLYVTRLLYLVEKFWDELTKFSRRKIDNLERWAKKYDKSPEDVVYDWKHQSWELDRYRAVNLTNYNTIEFRMFRGTLNIETYIATLQLCHTLVMTARYAESTEAIQNIKWEDLLQYDEIKSYWERVKNREV